MTLVNEDLVPNVVRRLNVFTQSFANLGDRLRDCLGGAHDPIPPA